MARILPGVAAARNYRRAWLRTDVIAGVTVAAYLVPQVMAYAQVAGLPPVVGLWAALAPLLLYALFGSSPQLSSGPESTTALMTATVVAPIAARDPERYAALAACLALIVAAICVVAWAARLGFLADMLSRPVLVGYLAGVALIMIAGQLGLVTGVPVHGTTFGEKVTSFLANLDQLVWPTVLMSGAVLVFLFVAGSRYPRAPGPLIAVLGAAAVVAIFSLSDHGVAVVGEIPSGLPSLEIPDVSLSDVAVLLPGALAVAIVGYDDNILDARAFAIRNGYRVDANQEWLALGASNAGCGLTQGFPVSSSGSRTVLGDILGSRSQLYSLVTLGALAVTLVLLPGVLATFPTAALGAIVIYAAVRLVDTRGFRRLRSFRGTELGLAVATTVAVVALGPLVGVLVAVGLSVLELLARVARPHDAILGRVPGLAGMHDVDDYPQARTIPGLVVYRYDSPLFFANAEDFRRSALAALEESSEADAERRLGEGADTGEPVRWFLLNFEAIVEVDLTAVDALEELRAELERRGIVMALARVKHEMYAQLDRAGFVAALGPERIYPTLPVALGAYQRWRLTHGLDPA